MVWQAFLVQRSQDEEKTILKIAIGYGHKEKDIPLLTKEESRRLEEIFSVVNKSDRRITAEEKKQVIEKTSTPKIITDAFIKAIQSAPFQTPNSKRGEKFICFKKDRYVYLLEPGFRDLFLSQLPEDLAAAFGDGFRRIGNMSQPTVALINHLKELGWLVEEGNGMRSECGLWTVEIGTKVFNGVLAVNLPESISSDLPENSEYEVRFNCPLKIGLKTVNKPEDRIPREDLSALEKKAKQLSAVHGGDYKKILEQLKKAEEGSPPEPAESNAKVISEKKPEKNSGGDKGAENPLSDEEVLSLEKKAKQLVAAHGGSYQKVLSEIKARKEAEKLSKKETF
ncbi:hypothetical protein P8S54_08110 [Thiomicrospira sp. R3]|uniref:hypothetical protein n=1 Tax=Thiomicrospira sp. R3 TaxID=3035472 RepID=UPI00259B2ACC|nr:hypothetical protein [Thiomicrospira sp. R3]WFE68178.1 hypothetical protein P8S54_08110 [Thiomicrospira sp. R3]